MTKQNLMVKLQKKFNTSPRYVGNVCGLNQHLLVVPCHRVVRSDGTLGGFSSMLVLS